MLFFGLRLHIDYNFLLYVPHLLNLYNYENK